MMMMLLNVANVEQKVKNLLDVRKKAMATADFTFVLLILPEDLSQNIRIYPLRIISDIYSVYRVFFSRSIPLRIVKSMFFLDLPPGSKHPLRLLICTFFITLIAYQLLLYFHFVFLTSPQEYNQPHMHFYMHMRLL